MSPTADSQVLELISSNLKRILNRLDVMEHRDNEDILRRLEALREDLGAMRESLNRHTTSEESRFMGLERRLSSLEPTR